MKEKSIVYDFLIKYKTKYSKYKEDTERYNELLNIFNTELNDSLIDEKSKQILKLRYLDCYSLEDIGKKYNITREAVRLKIASIFKRIRNNCIITKEYFNENEKGLKEYLNDTQFSFLKDRIINGIKKNDLMKKYNLTETKYNSIFNNTKRKYSRYKLLNDKGE